MLNNKEKRIKLQNENMSKIKTEANTKQERGITLVALSITIVILIILSTVTIGAITGENGLIEQAQKSKDAAEEMVDNESSKMNRLMQEYANIMEEDGEIESPGTTPPGGDGEIIPPGEDETTSNTIENTLKEGQYVNYVDTTWITRKCVVLYGPENENYASYGIQIIPMECVETLTLGGSNFDANKDLYNDVINYLNNATQKYLNTTYAESVRCVGSVPNNPSYDGAGMFTSSYSNMSSYNGIFKDLDENYKTDLEKMQALNNINDIGESYWLASRRLYSSSSTTNFGVRSTNTGGGLHDQKEANFLCRVIRSGYSPTSSASHGLRPVFTLKPGTKVIGGIGSSGNPYELGV